MRRRVRGLVLLAGFIGLLAGPAAGAGNAETSLLPPVQAKGGWSLVLPKEDRVVFRGLPSFDEAGAGSYAMLYPAPNIAGLFAAVFTHGLLVESQKTSQKVKLEEAANKVLDPYQPVLASFGYRELMQRTLKITTPLGGSKLLDAAVPASNEMLIEASPVFLMTQDQRAIVVDSTIAIYKPGISGGPGYKSTIRVVSTPLEGAEPVASLTAKEGERLKDISARVLAEVIKIALNDADAGGGADEAPFKTIRYQQGGAEKIERAQLLQAQCGRLLIRTLRGNLMSVPARSAASNGSPGPECAGSAVSHD